MNPKEKLLGTLNFQNMKGEGCVVETFYPWTLTADRWVTEGLPKCYKSVNLYPPEGMTEPVCDFERYLGFDGMKRLEFRTPYRLYCEGGGVTDWESWLKVKEGIAEFYETNYSDEEVLKNYSSLKEGHDRGEYTIRLSSTGFFWIPRYLFGVEEHLYAFYDHPDIMHDINQFFLDMFTKYMTKVTVLLQPEVLYFAEDLSGKNGPMISPECFDEFLGAYYKKLTPVLKANGVQNIFVDTDGEFSLLIPNFLKAGIDGFLPMDVNAGMDIVKVREQFPTVKFIGAYNKLELEKTKEDIDREFARLLPVIRQGGYVPGLDHQATPDTPYENYLYYIERLKEVMKQAGADCAEKK